MFSVSLQFACASPSKVSKLSPELSDLVVYTCSVPFKSFDQAAKRPPNEMSSFSESKALKHIKNSGDYRCEVYILKRHKKHET